MESLKKIRINWPLLKEIRQIDNYPKYMKDLASNKQLTKEDDEVIMNPRCSALLQNQLPLKENDLGIFILPCSIRRLDFNNTLAYLGASISIMPFSMFKRLEIGKLKPINMVIEMADNTKCISKGIDARNLRRPLLATAYAKVDIFRKAISLEVGNEKRRFKDPDGCKESKENEILGTIINKLHHEWFKGTDEDDDDLKGIIDYLEPTLYDGFIDLGDKEYKEMKCRLLGMPYVKPPPILIKNVSVTRYSIGLREVYTKMKVSEVEELYRTRGNIAKIRAGIMEEILGNDDEKESYDET
ncbi:hypothetical protein Tco_0859590 [Tanacetum coccineum]|uniref:Uncharacterized protein n=1 Tax=Tanacetum coccineum TaxID=301880 RepID=A0ABQ5BDE7_9ASTR